MNAPQKMKTPTAAATEAGAEIDRSVLKRGKQYPSICQSAIGYDLDSDTPQQVIMTVRQVFYQGTVHRVVDKTEAGYSQVQRALVDLQRCGRIPYGWIADNTRWTIKPETFRNAGHALRQIAKFYRKRLWEDLPHYAEVWIEKDALSSVVSPVTAEFDVPLMVTRGYASLAYLHNAAEHIKAIGKPTFIYHLGDFDPSGQDAAQKIEREIRHFAPEVPLTFKRLAVLPQQITEWNLPTRPTKMSDTRAKGFGEISVELDAIYPNRLRQMVQEALEVHLPEDQFEVLRAAEDSEREFLHAMARYA